MSATMASSQQQQQQQQQQLEQQDLSLLAAQSAHNSLKRARDLFDQSAVVAFIPPSDEALTEASILRRRRFLFGDNQLSGSQPATVNSSLKNVNQGALIVAGGDSATTNAGGTSTTTTGTSTALTVPTQQQTETGHRPGGILVVRTTMYR